MKKLKSSPKATQTAKSCFSKRSDLEPAKTLDEDTKDLLLASDYGKEARDWASDVSRALQVHEKKGADALPARASAIASLSLAG